MSESTNTDGFESAMRIFAASFPPELNELESALLKSLSTMPEQFQGPLKNLTKSALFLGWNARAAIPSPREKELQADNDELNATFDLMHAAQQRAIQMWREQDPDGRKLKLPDIADLFIWTWQELERLTKLEEALRFYADKANYDFVKGTSLIIPIYEDVGAKAREALNSKKVEE